MDPLLMLLNGAIAFVHRARTIRTVCLLVMLLGPMILALVGASRIGFAVFCVAACVAVVAWAAAINPRPALIWLRDAQYRRQSFLAFGPDTSMADANVLERLSVDVANDQEDRHTE